VKSARDLRCVVSKHLLDFAENTSEREGIEKDSEGFAFACHPRDKKIGKDWCQPEASLYRRLSPSFVCRALKL
jgi:hypothetical protein